MARPKKAAADKHDRFLRIPVTADQHRIVMDAAGRATTEGFASWARAVLLKAATDQAAGSPGARGEAPNRGLEN